VSDPYLPVSAPGAADLVPSIPTDQRDYGPSLRVLGWVGAVLTLGYLLPTAIGVQRGRSNAGSIAVVNIVLGWSVIGWLVALIWASVAHSELPPAPAPNTIAAPPAWYPQPDGSLKYWSGTNWVNRP
jgi:hypothetical protein